MKKKQTNKQIHIMRQKQLVLLRQRGGRKVEEKRNSVPCFYLLNKPSWSNPHYPERV